MKQFMVVLASFSMLISSCGYRNGRRVTGSGRISTQQRTVSNFSGVETQGSIDITVSQGNYKVEVEADENLQSYIETNVENGNLIVKFRNGIWLNHYKTARVHIWAPQLNDFEIHGSGNISGEGKITNAGKINVRVSGSGDVDLNLDCPEIITETHASGNIDLEGECKTIHTQIFGSGNLKASRLKAETVSVEVHGSGDTEVFASESLDVKILGSGDVQYGGNPKVSSEIHGSGSVNKE
jgi:hypothetical protein